MDFEEREERIEPPFLPSGIFELTSENFVLGRERIKVIIRIVFELVSLWPCLSLITSLSFRLVLHCLSLCMIFSSRTVHTERRSVLLFPCLPFLSSLFYVIRPFPQEAIMSFFVVSFLFHIHYCSLTLSPSYLLSLTRSHSLARALSLSFSLFLSASESGQLHLSALSGCHDALLAAARSAGLPS